MFEKRRGDVTLNVKHYLALAQLIILGMIVWSGVHLGMTILAHRLEDRVQRQTQVRTAPNRAPQTRTLGEYKSIVTSNLFSSQPAATPTGESTETTPVAGPPQQRAGMLRLKGTIVLSRPEDSFAILEVSGKQELHRVGDKVEGMEILRVLPEMVEIREGGAVVRLALDKEESEGPTSPRYPAPDRSRSSPSHQTGSDRLARRVGANSFIVDRDALNENTTDLTSLLSQVTIQPFIKDGQPYGFQVTSIAPGSIFTDFGLRNNDVVLKVNGVPIRQPDDVIGLYQQFQQLDMVRLEIERGGRPVTLTYALR